MWVYSLFVSVIAFEEFDRSHQPSAINPSHIAHIVQYISVSQRTKADGDEPDEPDEPILDLMMLL